MSLSLGQAQGMMGGVVRADQADAVEMEFKSMKDTKKGKGKGLAPKFPLPPIPDSDQEEDEHPKEKRRKYTTAADVKVQMKMAAAEKNKAQEKEIRGLRSIYCAYMKHSLLRPILDAELGPSFFKRIPSSKEELVFKLDEIRSVFNRAGINEHIVMLILFVAERVENLPPQLTGGYDFSGLSVTLAIELQGMEQLIAEVECEYGGWLEASLAKRLLFRIVKIAQNVAATNASLAGSTPTLPSAIPAPLPVDKKLKQKNK